MANTIEERQNQGIKNSWSLRDFAKSHGRMQKGHFTGVDQITGEMREFDSIIFTDPNNPNQQTNKIFVNFSSKIGTMSAQEIKSQVDDLQVVELNGGSHILCRRGSNAWEDIEL